MSASDVEPRCYLEKLALEVFHHHVPPPSPHFFYDPETSGAEWWVQIRPSPPAGRYSQLADANDKDDDMGKTGISFHWDKDEDLRLLTGGSMYIHPHLSTVTYLTDLGAPTMVLSKRVNPMTGEYLEEGDGENVDGFVSWPKRGKHLSFDARYLHAAPSDLMEKGLFDKQCKFEVSDDMDEKEKKVLQRRHRRVTFLVNIWLNYKPFNVNSFPETMIGNLSKTDMIESSLFGSDGKKDKPAIVRLSVDEDKAVIENTSADKDENQTTVVKKTWPMGGCDSKEQIEVPMPINIIRSDGGSDVQLTWHKGVIGLK